MFKYQQSPQSPTISYLHRFGMLLARCIRNLISCDRSHLFLSRSVSPRLCLFHSGLSSQQTSQAQRQIEFECCENFICSLALHMWVRVAEFLWDTEHREGSCVALSAGWEEKGLVLVCVSGIPNHRVAGSDNSLSHTIKEHSYRIASKEKHTPLPK